ncbi:MAG: hypothetical protein REI11_21315 [Patulibacter sp.]|nr:hypothetical protein [Patulibacter sp.]
MPLDTGKSPEFVRALSRIAVEGAAKAMPDRTWATITDAADVPAGSIVLHLGHVTEKMWGDIRNGDVPVYEIEAGEMRRLFNYDGGGEAFEAFFLMERAITFYETEAENSETPGVLREAWRLAGELTRASLSVARIHWESGDDEGEDSWRATYAGWQASERDLMAWLERGAAGQNAS